MAEMAGDWTDVQNEAIVADYFAMLADDLTGRPYNKAEHNRMLQGACCSGIASATTGPLAGTRGDAMRRKVE
jgi:hypothetical protein